MTGSPKDGAALGAISVSQSGKKKKKNRQALAYLSSVMQSVSGAGRACASSCSQKQLDAIIGFPNQSHWDQFQADIRYLTHIGGHQTEVAVVFPLSGAVTAFVRGGNEVEWWSIAQDWLTDIRPSRRSWGRARHRTNDGIAIAKRAHRCERFERSLARA